MPDSLIWTISILFILIGLLGCVVPGIPGAPLILLGGVIHKLCLPDRLTWWTIGALCLLTAITSLLNLLITGYTAQKAGASRLATVAAILGALIGLWMSLLWIFLLPLLLAFGVEYGIKRKKATASALISAKVGLGLFLSTLLQFGLALLMVTLLIIDCFWI